MSILITVIITIITVVYYINHRYSYWKKRKVPFLKPNFPFGNIEIPFFNKRSLGHQIKSIYDNLKQKNVKYGGIFLFLKPVFVPIDPEYIKLILVKDFNYFDNRGLYLNQKDQPVSANILTIDGKQWRIIRNKFSPAFSLGKVKSMTRGMFKCSDNMILSVKRNISRNEAINPKDVAARYTVDVTGACIFGLECNSFDNNQNVYFKEVERMVNKSFTITQQIFCQAFPNIARFLGIVHFNRDSVDFFVNIINEVVKYRRYSNEIRRDFVNIMMDGQKQEFEESKSITSVEIAAQSLVFFFAGFETSASTIAFTLYELAVNHDVQDKVREDIEMVFKKYDDEITYDGIGEMQYLNMAVCETLRKYPPIAILNRKCSEDYKLPNDNITIYKGTDVVIPVMPLHMDPDIYPNPEKYDPMRFTDENIAKRSSGTYIPFGDGPRNCLANRFGTLETKIALISLIKKFKFNVSPKMRLPLQFANTLSLLPLHEILLDVENV